MLVDPHHCGERAEVPLDLLAHVGLLNLDSDPLVGPVIRL